MKRSWKIILAVIAAILLVFSWLKLSAINRLTDSQQIELQLSSAVTAANNKDPRRVMGIISRDYQDDNGDNSIQLGVLLQRGFESVQNVSVSLSPINVTVNGDSAQSTCYIIIDADGRTAFNQAVTLDWKKEPTRRYLIFPDHEWRVVHSSSLGLLINGN